MACSGRLNNWCSISDRFSRSVNRRRSVFNEDGNHHPVREMIIECPSCGFKLSPDVTHCPKCGAELGLAVISDLEDLANMIQRATGPEDLVDTVGALPDDGATVALEDGNDASLTDDGNTTEGGDDDPDMGSDSALPQQDDAPEPMVSWMHTATPSDIVPQQQGDAEVSSNDPDGDDEGDIKTRKRRFRIFGR